MALTPQFGAIVPSQSQQILAANYLQFDGGANDFAQQYLPELYEQEVNKIDYTLRTLTVRLHLLLEQLLFL